VYIINGAIGVFFPLAMESAIESTDGTNLLNLLILPVTFLVQSGIISSRHNTDFGRACLISLAVWLIWFVILIVIILIALACGAVPSQFQHTI
jgi:hypothetical protein